MQINELMNIQGKEFELTNDRIDDIRKPFIPLAEEFKEFVPQLSKVLEKQEVTPELCKQAKRLKLDIAKVRTSTKKVKDTEKKSALQVGNAIQKCHNVIVETIQDYEGQLDKIVKHFENLEIERKKELRLERISMLVPYNVENVEDIALGEMDQVVFEAFLKNAEAQHKEKIEAEAKEKAKLEAEREENERLKKENEELMRVQKEKEAELEKEKQGNLKLQQDKQAEEARVQKEKEDNERLKKETKYKDWLKENEGTYDKILKEDGKVVLYKKVAEYKI